MFILKMIYYFLFKKIFTQPECLPERPYPSSWSCWRVLFTEKILLEHEAEW